MYSICEIKLYVIKQKHTKTVKHDCILDFSNDRFHLLPTDPINLWTSTKIVVHSSNIGLAHIVFPFSSWKKALVKTSLNCVEA